MLLQTNSYVVPRERRSEHARIVRRFKQALQRLGCDQFEVYEQAGANWSTDEGSGRFVQIMRFRDRRHQLAVQAAERNDPMAQAIIAEFCELINFSYQHQQGLFAIGYYTSILNSGRDRDAEQPQGASDAAARSPVPPPHPQAAALDAVLHHANAQGEGTKVPTEIIEQATALASVPFADVPMHEAASSAAEPITGGASPVNGSALSHEPPPDPDTIDPQASARELDQMIRRHFGEEPETPVPGTLSEPPAELNVHASEIESGGSGIGAILDAAKTGVDLDDTFAAELLESEESDATSRRHQVTEHSEPPHTHSPPIEEFHRDEDDR